MINFRCLIEADFAFPLAFQASYFISFSLWILSHFILYDYQPLNNSHRGWSVDQEYYLKPIGKARGWADFSDRRFAA